MIIFGFLFLAIFSIAQMIFGAFFASIEAVTSVCALAIFACIAVAVFMKVQRAWGWMFIAIILMVAVEYLAPYESMIEIIVSIIVAIIGAVFVKRPILSWLRADAQRPTSQGGPKVPSWLRTVLTIV